MANKLKKLMKPILKQKCSQAYQEGYKMGRWEGFKQKKMAYESEIDCLKMIQFALYRSVPKWIPVSERLPEKDGFVLVYTIDQIVGEADLVNRKEFYWAGSDDDAEPLAVTHWMPLPEPPKE